MRIAGRSKLIALSLAVLTLIGTASSAFADRNQYTGNRSGYRYHGGYHHGWRYRHNHRYYHRYHRHY